MPFALTDDRLVNVVITKVELGYNDEETTPAIDYIELDARSVAFEETTTTLTTEGTTQTWDKEVTDRMTLTLENQVLQRALNKAFMGDPATTVTGVVERYGYTGDPIGRNYAVRLSFSGTDADSGADVNLQQTFHKCQSRRYTPRDGAVRRGVPTQRTALTAVKTSTDILGVAIAGVTKPVYYTEDKLAA